MNSATDSAMRIVRASTIFLESRSCLTRWSSPEPRLATIASRTTTMRALIKVCTGSVTGTEYR